MSTPFLGQVKIVGFDFAPKGWAFCNGQLMAINQNQALFALLGTTYGGNGQTTFALPDLQGRAPVHVNVSGPGFPLGDRAGEETHTLLLNELPAHSHQALGTVNQGTAMTPAGNVLAEKPRRGKNVYASSPSVNDVQPLDPGAVSVAGGNQPHENLQPSLVLNFVIALQGIFPSRN